MSRRKERQHAEEVAQLTQFDEQLENAKSITNIFNKLVALDKLRQSAFSNWSLARSDSFLETEMANREGAVKKLEEQIVRDNYDAINDSDLADMLFPRFPAFLKSAFDAVTLERAFAPKAPEVEARAASPQAVAAVLSP